MHIRSEQDLCSHLAQPVVELVVLITHQLYVKRARTLDDGSLVSRKRNRVRQHRLVRCRAESCATDPEERTHRIGDNTRERRLTNSLQRTTYAVDVVMQEMVHATSNIVIGNRAVSIYPDNHVTTRLRDSQVQASRNDLSRVVDRKSV